MLKQVAIIGFLIAAAVVVELSSLAHPIERTMLNAAGWLSRAVRVDEPYVQFAAQAQQAARTQRSQENSELEKQLAFRDRTQHAIMSARVYGYSLDPLRSQLIIDRGSEDGIHTGDPVVAGDGILLGLVKTVNRRESMIIPLSDPRSKVLASIVRENSTVFGMVQGRFNVGVEMSLIPITDKVRVGDIVVTAGLAKRIPAGLAIGTILDVKKKPADLFQTGVLQLPYNRPPLDVSIIITPSNESH